MKGSVFPATATPNRSARPKSLRFWPFSSKREVSYVAMTLPPRLTNWRIFFALGVRQHRDSGKDQQFEAVEMLGFEEILVDHLKWIRASTIA